MDSQKSLTQFAITAFLLLEIGFWLNGFLGVILIATAVVIGLSILIIAFGHLEKIKASKKKLNMSLLIILLPLVSVFYNPTKYLYQVDESILILSGYCEGGTFGPSLNVILTEEGDCYWVTNNFWWQKVEKAEYEIINDVISIDFGNELYKMNLRIKGKIEFLCSVSEVEPNYNRCFEIDKNKLSDKLGFEPL